VGNIVTELRVN